MSPFAQLRRTLKERQAEMTLMSAG